MIRSLRQIERGEVAAPQDAKRRAAEQPREGGSGFVVRHRKILIRSLPQPHAIGRKAFAVVIDDDRQHHCAVGERRDAPDMTDAVLQYGNARRRRAQAMKPRRRRFRLVRLGAEEDPVGGLGLRWIGQRAQPHLHRAARLLERQPLDRPAHTGDDIVPPGRGEAPGGDAADAAKSDHGHRQTLFCRH